MSDSPYAETASRVRRALAGDPGDPCVGVTFLADEAVRALAWGGSAEDPLLTAVCSRLSPDFAFVSSWEADAASTCERVAACGTVPFWVVRGPLDGALEASGWHETLARTAGDPGGLAPELDEAVDIARGAIGAAVECGAAAVVIADDLAGAKGLLVSPDYALTEVVPRLGRIAGFAAAEGLAAIWHSDGDIRALLGAAARAGLAGVHPGGLGPEPFRRLLGQARAEGLVVLGGLPAWALRAGVPQALQAATSASLIARSGGLLICDDGGIGTGEELGAFVAAMQAVRKGT